MARAYLQRQGQEREPEPVSARTDGPHRYRCSQKQGHQCHHHHHSVAGDVHAPPPSVCPAGAAPRSEVVGAAEEAGGVATCAAGVGEDDLGARPLVISSRARSSRTCRKVGKGLRAIQPFRWS